MIKYTKNIILPRSLILLFSSVMLLSACYKMSDYSGDGFLIDYGASAAIDRYILDLGPIDFSHKGTNKYRIVNLPDRNFVVGIKVEVSEQNQSIIEIKNIDPVIKLKLSKADGDVVFSKEAKLSSWTWSILLNESQAFIFGRGESGTYFQPIKHTEYTLSLTVHEVDYSKSEYAAFLVAKSGGWK